MYGSVVRRRSSFSNSKIRTNCGEYYGADAMLWMEWVALVSTAQRLVRDVLILIDSFVPLCLMSVILSLLLEVF